MSCLPTILKNSTLHVYNKIESQIALFKIIFFWDHVFLDHVFLRPCLFKTMCFFFQKLKTMFFENMEYVFLKVFKTIFFKTVFLRPYFFKTCFSQKFLRTCFFSNFSRPCFLRTCFVQLNAYETASYFIYFSQNLTCDCLLISVFCPKFTWAEPKIVLFWCSKLF